jgi:NAD(P)-dependent dehydrogenase (short-subunit alcohol dehydrogenase family)
MSDGRRASVETATNVSAKAKSTAFDSKKMDGETRGADGILCGTTRRTDRPGSGGERWGRPEEIATVALFLASGD